MATTKTKATAEGRARLVAEAKRRGLYAKKKGVDPRNTPFTLHKVNDKNANYAQRAILKPRPSLFG